MAVKYYADWVAMPTNRAPDGRRHPPRARRRSPGARSIYRGLSVEQNIRAVLESIEPDHRQRKRELDGVLEEFAIAGLRKRPAEALSGGQRRRVEIVRALAARPAYMLLDEPFAGVEPTAVAGIQALARQLVRRGIGVLIAGDLGQCARQTLDVSERAYVICSGDVLGTLMA